MPNRPGSTSTGVAPDLEWSAQLLILELIHDGSDGGTGGPAGAGGSAGRDPEVLPGLRDECDRGPGVAGRPGRAETGAPADPVRDVRRRLPARSGLEQVRPGRRRGDGPVPPAQRLRDLRHLGAAGPAVGDALSAGREPGELRLPGQRHGGRDALHRVPDGVAGHGDGPRHHREHRRLQAELRRQRARARRPALPVPEPAGERVHRDRGRDGHQHPHPQPARGRGGRAVGAGASRGDGRGAARGFDGAGERAGLPERGPDRRPARDRGRLPDRPRIGHHARGRRHRGGPRRTGPTSW